MRGRIAAAVLVGFVLVVPGLPSVASAQAADGTTWGYRLADELMSPFCPGRALSECPSGKAEDLRRWILSQEADGVPRDEVVEELYRVFGDQLRQAPRAEGVGLVAYAIPGVIFLGGAALVAVFLRRQRLEPDPAPAEADASSDPDGASADGEDDAELQRLVDEELRRNDEAGDR